MKRYPSGHFTKPVHAWFDKLHGGLWEPQWPRLLTSRETERMERLARLDEIFAVGRPAAHQPRIKARVAKEKGRER